MSKKDRKRSSLSRHIVTHKPRAHNSADEKAQNSLKNQEALIEQNRINDIQKSLEHECVRRMLWRLMCKTGIFEGVFDNSGWTGWRDGKRTIGLELMAEIDEAIPGMFAKMMHESINIDQLPEPDQTNDEEENSDG